MTNRITFENVRLAFDPELKFTQSGKAVCSIKFADQQRRKNENTGEWENASDALWVTASVWGPDGEAAAEQLHKGDKVTATGQLVAREYDRKDGSGKATSIELKFATVAKVPTAPKAQRTSGGFGGGDAWQQPQQQRTPEPAWGQGKFDEPAPF